MLMPDPQQAIHPEGALDFVEQMCAAGGPSSADYQMLSDAICVLHTHEHGIAGSLSRSNSERALIEDILDRYPDIFRTPETLQGLAWCKPRGYAGDFEMIRRIYRRHVATKKSLARWDAFFQAGAAPEAVRNRVKTLKGAIDNSRTRSLLSVGCGPGLDVAQALDGNVSVQRLAFLDVDEGALAACEEETRSLASGRDIQFLHRNALRWRSKEEYDLIWCSGLFDYLPDRIGIALLKRLLCALSHNGKLVIGNFGPENPSRPYMETIGRWYLIHRSSDDLKRMLTQAGCNSASVSISSDETGVNLFATAFLSEVAT